MSMRIGGLASGINTDELIAKLMQSERAPLNKMQQEKQKFEWQRDALRDLNKALWEFDTLLSDMSLSSKYKPTTIKSSLESAVTATGGSSNDSYEITVSSLASRAVNASKGSIGVASNGKKPNDPVPADWIGKEVKFTTYDENGEPDNHSFQIEAEDTLESVLKKISAESKDRVKAIYDVNSDKVILESTRAGQYHKSNNDTKLPEIEFSDDSFFATAWGMDVKNEMGGTDAVFTYNGVELRSKTNSYQINGLSLQFHDITPPGSSAKLVVQHDTDKAFENVMKFIDKYNEIVEKLNTTQQEKRYRDFPPLTSEQKEEMSEDQIKKWEEKAKSGLLRGDSIITNALGEMRTAMYQKIETTGQFKLLTEIGLETTSNYMDGGKIVLKNGQEDELRKALAKDPESVKKLFVGEGDTEGIIKQVRKAVTTARGGIDERAGKRTATTLENDTLGKRMTDLNKRISDFEKKLTQVETRYWNQFNAMEQAISRLNAQSTQLLSQFGGGMM